MVALATLLTGFSMFSALTLALTQFRGEAYQHQPLARIMGLVLLLALAGLQGVHFAWLYFDLNWTPELTYRVALFGVAPSFYLFSLPLLHPQRLPEVGSARRWCLLGHTIPVLLGAVLPLRWAQPAAFLVGAGYLLILGRGLWALRQERARFQREIVLLGAVFAIAIGASALGLMPTRLPGKLFVGAYAIAIGLAFFLVQLALNLRPQLPEAVQEAAQEVLAMQSPEVAYAHTTLSKVDCDAALAQLATAMDDSRIFKDPDLSLPALATHLGLSTHQLSELLNTRLGKNFPRYLRERRIKAAKSMLCDEPSASVLSVGLSVGFTAQSSFYDAFREIEGMTPGQYRKLHVHTAGSE